MLLVDDSPELRRAYTRVLEREGFEVKSAGTAEAALEILRGWMADVVVTDVFIPGMGGLELITRVRSDFPPPVPALVALSGFPAVAQEALGRGALRFEAKPVALADLVDIVEEAISRGGSEPARSRPAAELERHRATVRAVGEAVVKALFAREPEVLARLERGPRALSRLLGHSTCLILLLDDGMLKVFGSSAPDVYPVGSDAGDLRSIAEDVVASGASLLVPDLRANPLYPGMGSRRIRFLAAVPYMVDGAAVGAMCLVDDDPHDLLSCELGVLEHIATRASAHFINPLAAPVLDGRGLLSRGSFEAFFSLFSECAVRRRASMGLDVFAVAGDLRHGDSDLSAKLPPRVFGGVLDRHRAAIVALGETPELVQQRLRMAREGLEGEVEVSACAEMTFDDPVPPVSLAIVLDWANALLLRGGTPGASAFVAIDASRRRP